MSKISLFQHLPQKGQEHICDSVLEIAEFLNQIKYGTYKKIIDNVRQEQDKKKRDQLKRNLPSVTIAGVFKHRDKDKLIQHSGFLCIDVDGFNDKTLLIQDPYTYALFSSASGNGIAIIVKVNPDKHKESYNWLADYYYVQYGICVDPAPKNVASLRFVSYDESLFLNEKSHKAKTKSDKPKKVHTLPIIISDSKISDLVKQVHNSGKNIAPDYETYRNLGFALANGFGEQGRDYYHARSVDGVVQQLTQMQGVDESEAKSIAKEVFERDDITLSTVSNDPDKLIESLIEFLKQNHPIRKNEITKKLEENGSEVSEERLNTIYLRSRMIFNSKEITKDLVFSIIHSDIIPSFNPITEYIEKNRHRNNTGNIDAIIQTIESDTPHCELFIRKWLISIIAAYEFEPVRSVLALCGGQNTGKTEWFRRLLPSKLLPYYGESKLDAGKDDELLMCEKLMLIDDEMGGKSKQDEKHFKELTSKRTFSLRPAYGRNNRDYKRLAILGGTSNTMDILNDPTGNTRILPVNVISINHDAYNAINKDELFMECVRTYESGYDWQLNKYDLNTLAETSREFEQDVFEEEILLKFFAPESPNNYSEFLSVAEMKHFIEVNSSHRIQNFRKFSQSINKIFGKSLIKRTANSVIRGRYVSKVTLAQNSQSATT